MFVLPLERGIGSTGAITAACAGQCTFPKFATVKRKVEQAHNYLQSCIIILAAYYDPIYTLSENGAIIIITRYLTPVFDLVGN